MVFWYTKQQKKNLYVTTTNPNSLHIVSRGVVIGNWMSFCNLKSINNQ